MFVLQTIDAQLFISSFIPWPLTPPFVLSDPNSFNAFFPKSKYLGLLAGKTVIVGTTDVTEYTHSGTK